MPTKLENWEQKLPINHEVVLEIDYSENRRETICYALPNISKYFVELKVPTNYQIFHEKSSIGK